MTGSREPSVNPTGKPAPVNEPDPNAQDPPQAVTSFVHVLPCTNPPVKYLDSLDGCATGIHITRDDTQDLQVLCGKMADAILAKAGQPVVAATYDPCAVCKAPIVPSSTSPVVYIECCAHYFHYSCVKSSTFGFDEMCPHCRVPSSRALLWPQVFPTAEAKNEIFQLQKRSFGLHVAPQTDLLVRTYVVDEFPTFELLIKNEREFVNGKLHLKVRKRPSSGEGGRWNECDLSEISMRYPSGEYFGFAEYVRRWIQRLYLAGKPLPTYLGDILPLEENAQYKAEHGFEPLDNKKRRLELLLQFRCPFVKQVGHNGEPYCTVYRCEFWHGWSRDTPATIVEQVKIRDFPRYFCLENSRIPCMKGNEPIRVHSQELARCSTAFHPSNQDLKDIDAFAHKMAKQIMAPVVVPKVPEHLVCAFCHKTDSEPNSVWIHLQNCVHCLHVHCAPLAHRNNSSPNRKLDLHCPTCQVPSVRTIAWPGQFPSKLAKQTIFDFQLGEFKLLGVEAHTQLAIVEGANRVNVFTLDYGGPNVVTIDAAAAQDFSVILYD